MIMKFIKCVCTQKSKIREINLNSFEIIYVVCSALLTTILQFLNLQTNVSCGIASHRVGEPSSGNFECLNPKIAPHLRICTGARTERSLLEQDQVSIVDDQRL